MATSTRGKAKNTEDRPLPNASLSHFTVGTLSFSRYDSRNKESLLPHKRRADTKTCWEINMIKKDNLAALDCWNDGVPTCAACLRYKNEKPTRPSLMKLERHDDVAVRYWCSTLWQSRAVSPSSTAAAPSTASKQPPVPKKVESFQAMQEADAAQVATKKRKKKTPPDSSLDLSALQRQLHILRQQLQQCQAEKSNLETRNTGLNSDLELIKRDLTDMTDRLKKGAEERDKAVKERDEGIQKLAEVRAEAVQNMVEVVRDVTANTVAKERDIAAKALAEERKVAAKTLAKERATAAKTLAKEREDLVTLPLGKAVESTLRRRRKGAHGQTIATDFAYHLLGDWIFPGVTLPLLKKEIAAEMKAEAKAKLSR